ncbi:hypothetical protein COCC4DRAFT_60470 [Bipolaris maydis ATCC 48331]|uniref:Major facilitator superfamily (MFS) profile domain-containing protein n=2 Tax=Cochliobolus heterostrophus TaxID=5016 RepID=M2ULP0_COCH5|nr:uncharacterized protein COCC4DRAFT_60470 [Bipolaris maydis ATCC 48331]EMD88863.1 hypothetical protein COCHEDRAFT_66612 [Bipolaris maydis C5]KAH7556501.1 hypothetical protein BM1_05935 [Bipolaris maydis]ENI05421.1 hypothetical protein COCC4DRAFT_60470 [Bipolaris maydis ATCC 48331]KAJ5028563.1 major facilitator superfamily-domain-containing protein [Bipolaris maydis]KAJ5063343.1 major facilitator superfamily-domain-containing protein [Bipolaris maydis]
MFSSANFDEENGEVVVPEKQANSEPSSSSTPNAKLDSAEQLTYLNLSSSLSNSNPSAEWTRSHGFWRSFIAICIPLLLSALGGSITNTALPTISEALNLNTKFSWIATDFLLASTVFQPLYSQLGDMWGRKRPMMAAIAVFALGSAICAGARSGPMLISGRILQGLGTGGIDLFAEMILCDIVPLRKRGPYLAIKHVAFAAGTTMGPLLGGVFAEQGWYSCFLINTPVCIISLAIMWIWLSVDEGLTNGKVSIGDNLRKTDYIGSGMLTGSVLMILVALSTDGARWPWNHPSIITLIVLGTLGLIGFIFWERSRFFKYPIMPPHVFSNRTTNIVFALTVMHGIITYGFQFYLPLYFQAVEGSSPSNSGVEVMPTTLVIVIIAALGGPILSFTGRYKHIHMAGFVCVTLGQSLCIMLDHSTSPGVWISIQLIIASGLGIVIPTMLPAIQAKLPKASTGASAGSWAFLRGTESLFGVAIPGAVFNARFTSLLPSIFSPGAQAKLSHGRAYQCATASFINRYGTTPTVKSEIVTAYTQSLRSIWIIFTVVAAVGFCISFCEKEYKMRTVLNTVYGLKSKQMPSNGEPAGSSTPPFSAASIVSETEAQTPVKSSGEAAGHESKERSSETGL